MLVNEILAPLLAEEARLDAELQGMPAFRQLEAVRVSIRALRTAYEGSDLISRPAADAGKVAASRTASSQSDARRGRRPGSITGRITQYAEEAMRTLGRRMTSGEVFALIIDKGVQVNGVNPQKVVSSILSHEPQFDNKFDDRGQGYGLKEWSVSAEMREGYRPDDVGASHSEPQEAP